MRKVWIILQREYITRVRKKSFILATLLAPLGFAMLFVITAVVSNYGESKKRIAVLDESGYFDHKLKDDNSLYFFFEDTTLAYLEATYKANNYNGILYIPQLQNLSSPRGIQYRSEEQIGLRSKQYIEEQIRRAIKDVKIEQANIDKEVLRDISNVDVQLESTIYGEEGEEKGSSEIAAVIGLVLGLAIYMVMFIYGTMLMRSVIEEKTNRIVEVMISSVKPIQLMLGKILGVGAVGITQFILWGILINIVSIIMGIAMGGSFGDLSQLSSQPGMEAGSVDEAKLMALMNNLDSIKWGQLFFYFMFYFLSGYLLYGALFAAVGAATNDDGDMQSFTFIVSLPVVASVFILTTVIQEPNSALAIWASMIPFSAPIVMPARIAFGVPGWQIAISMLSVILGFLFTTWLAARIYRTGILMYGKKVTLKELAKWVVRAD